MMELEDVNQASPGGAEGSWGCLLTAGSAFTATAGISFQTLSSVLPAGAADLATQG